MTEEKFSSPAGKQIQSESHPVIGKDGGVLPLPLPPAGGPPTPPSPPLMYKEATSDPFARITKASENYHSTSTGSYTKIVT
jgi:hypothetical protein